MTFRPIKSLTATVALCACFVACDQPGQTERQKETKATEQAMTARTEAEQKAQNAQASAEKDIASARIDFEKARQDYLHSKRVDLVNLDGKLIDLEWKARTTKNAKSKTDLEASLPSVRAQRDTFARRLQALDNEPAATWDTAKANADKDWDALKAAVDKAD